MYRCIVLSIDDDIEICIYIYKYMGYKGLCMLYEVIYGFYY